MGAEREMAGEEKAKREACAGSETQGATFKGQRGQPQPSATRAWGPESYNPMEQPPPERAKKWILS